MNIFKDEVFYIEFNTNRINGIISYEAKLNIQNTFEKTCHKGI